MHEIISNGAVTLVMSIIAKAGGRKHDSRLILLTGVSTLAIPVLESIRPLIDTLSKMFYKISDILYSINLFLSSVENSTLVQFILDNIK